MKKVCSIILVFSLLFFNSQGVFAGNGYPLTPEHICDIREKLMEWAKSKQTSTIEFKWEKKPDYYLLSDEYRTIKVYNIPHLFYYDGQKKSDDKGFFETYLRALLSAYKAQESFKSYENEAKEAVADYLINRLDEEFKKYNCPFRDCYHINEKECNVKKAITGDEILKERYENYIKFINNR